MGSKTPLLYVGLNEDKAHLSKVDMNLARSLGSNGREEVLSLESMCNIVEFLAIASEKDCPSARPISNSNDISLNVSGTVCGRCKRLVVASVAVGSVRNRGFVVT